jgi:hypothetical protein
LQSYTEVLEFQSEYQLNADPLKIDLLIIKKEPGVIIDKNFASIFRRWNIFEFKSPEDHLTVEDFYKTYGYACLYSSFKKAAVSDQTITLVTSAHPEKLLKHLREERGYQAEEKWSGIYVVTGDIMPIQIIETKRLTADNFWLKDLSANLDYASMDKVLHDTLSLRKEANVRAYLYALLRANPKTVEEVMHMSDDALTLEDVLVRNGWTARWEARGKEQEAREVIRKALKKGIPIADIAYLTGYDTTAVEAYKQQLGMP